MAEEYYIKFSDLIIVAATLTGPVIAVQVQKFIERATERRSRKIQIFRTLMATRATRLSVEHVNAVNAIELEFGPSPSLLGRQSKADQKVLEAYKFYLDRLRDDAAQDLQQVTAWNEKCFDLFIDLLHAMSENLGYNFDKATIRRSAYHPKGHAEIEISQNLLREYALKIANGSASIPMRLVTPNVKSERSEDRPS